MNISDGPNKIPAEKFDCVHCGRTLVIITDDLIIFLDFPKTIVEGEPIKINKDDVQEIKNWKTSISPQRAQQHINTFIKMHEDKCEMRPKKKPKWKDGTPI